MLSFQKLKREIPNILHKFRIFNHVISSLASVFRRSRWSVVKVSILATYDFVLQGFCDFLVSLCGPHIFITSQKIHEAYSLNLQYLYQRSLNSDYISVKRRLQVSIILLQSLIILGQIWSNSTIAMIFVPAPKIFFKVLYLYHICVDVACGLMIFTMDFFVQRNSVILLCRSRIDKVETKLFSMYGDLPLQVSFKAAS